MVAKNWVLSRTVKLEDEQLVWHTAPLNSWLTLPRFHSELTPSTKNASYGGLCNPEQQHSTFNPRNISIIFFLFSYRHKLFGLRPSNNCSRGCNTLYMAHQIFLHLGIFDLCISGLWPITQLRLTNYEDAVFLGTSSWCLWVKMRLFNLF